MKKNLVILGAGESGTGAAILGIVQGWNVFVSDYGTIDEDSKSELNTRGISWEEGKHTEETILKADVVIKSPGISPKVAIVQKCIAANIPIISEIEFGSWYTSAKIIGITGTNGKSTTTMLTYHLLKEAGLNVGLGGNIGQSFARQVAENNFDIYVLELSSFQLDDCHKLKLQIGCVTNITEDHLDRYDYKLSNYINSKMRIGQNQSPEEFLVYCVDDHLIKEGFQNIPQKATLIPFSMNQELEFGAWYKEGNIHIKLKNTQYTIDMTNVNLRGKHNTYNTMAAAVMASLIDVRKESIRESLSNFNNLEHRLEFVARVNGVEYINDSKATNVNSAWYALESMDKPVIWIAGGVDKGNDYTDLIPLVKNKVKMIICLGLDNIKIHKAFQNSVDMIINTQSAKEAVYVASKMSESGDAVLLSPACASFDLFENYEERGRLFKQAVKNL